VNVLNGLIAAIPSLVSQISNNITNPVLSAINGYLNQLTNFTNNNSSAVNQSIQTSFNRALDSNQIFSNNLSRNIDDLTNTLSDSMERNIDENNTNISSLLGVIGVQSERYAQVAENTVSQLADQLSEFSRSLSDNLGDELTRDLDDLGDSVNFTLGKLSERLPEWLQQILDMLIELASEIGRMIIEGVSPIFRPIFERFAQISDTMENLKKGGYNSADKFIDDMFGSGVSGDIVGFLFQMIGIIPLFISLSQLSAQPSYRALEHLVNTQYPNFLLSPDVYTNWLIKNPERRNEFNEYMGKLGLNPRQSEILINSKTQNVDVPMIVDWYLRDKSREDKFTQYLGKMNFSNQEMNIIREVINVIPPLNDIITMSVREVFNPGKRALLGLDKGFPDEVAKWAEKKGLSRQWALNYWAAHWQPVSPQQAFEMYHRGLINKEVLRDLLEIADYPPSMIDNLIAIAYNPLTRVDIRRMFKQGNMTYDQMTKAHQDIGLSPENARFLSDFVVGSITDDDDKYTASVRTRVFNAVEKAFEDGTISRDEAITAFKVLQLSEQTAVEIVNLVTYEKAVLQRKQETDKFNNHAIALVKSSFAKGALPRVEAQTFLTSLGLSNDDAIRTLNLLELERQIKLKGIAEDTAKTMYGQYKIDQNEMYVMLDNLGFTAQEKYFIWYEADLLRKKRTKMLTEKQYEKLFKDKIISEDEYYDNLRGIGYTDEDATYLVYQDIMAFGA
jgi:hypothetical protein